VATRKLIQMHVLQAQSALPPPLLLSTGIEVFKPCQPLLFPSSNRSCTQVVTFPYGRRSFCSGTVPEGKAEGDYQSGKRARNLQNKLGSEPSERSLWEWFRWVLLSVGAKACLFSLTAAWMLSLVGGDLFSRVDADLGCMRSCVRRYDHELMGPGRTEDGCPRVRRLSVLH